MQYQIKYMGDKLGAKIQDLMTGSWQGKCWLSVKIKQDELGQDKERCWLEVNGEKMDTVTVEKINQTSWENTQRDTKSTDTWGTRISK